MKNQINVLFGGGETMLLVGQSVKAAGGLRQTDNLKCGDITIG